MLNQFGDDLSYKEFRLLAEAGGEDLNCTRDEYVLHMLTKMGKVTQSDLDFVGKSFDKLDLNGDLVLNGNSYSENLRSRLFELTVPIFYTDDCIVFAIYRSGGCHGFAN